MLFCRDGTVLPLDLGLVFKQTHKSVLVLPGSVITDD